MKAASEVMPGGNTRSVLYYAPFPLGVACGQGCYLMDLDGHRYVDFLGEYTACIYGHSHPVIRAALEGAMDDGLNFGAPNVLEVRLAQAVCQRFPSNRIGALYQLRHGSQSHGLNGSVQVYQA